MKLNEVVTINAIFESISVKLNEQAWQIYTYPPPPKKKKKKKKKNHP